MARRGSPQLAYSELMDTMLDEEHRRGKARKILAVLRHFLGRDELSGRVVADVGCSAGYIADELSSAGASRVLGFDIDVPGLGKAQQRFGGHVQFCCASGDRLPLPDQSLDVVVFNHIYEHVVDPDAVVAELGRVLRPGGVMYLGLGNRLGVIEPHYRLPFLSWLPGPVADRYVRASGRADHYYERFRTRPGLRALLSGYHVWDYTLPVLTAPRMFASDDIVPGPVSRAPHWALRAAMPLVPTYIWVATTGPSRPAGPPLPLMPTPVPTRPRAAA
jgi:SAM-dependent methyltransferase